MAETMAGTAPAGDANPAGERALLSAARRGDAAAFEALVRTHSPALLRLVRRLGGSVEDAEDVVQETLLSAHRGLPRFRGEAPLRSWLARIAVNAYRDMVRATRRLVRICATAPLREPVDTERTLAGRDTVRRVMQAIEDLPPRQREALLLRIHEGLSYAEIAGHMGVGRDAVRMNLLEARRKLLRRFQREIEEA
ncbi:MAG: RNA polymerase sigma factor [Planctomycetota bacterium]